MCGICGVYNIHEQPVVPETIVKMTATLRHRGPDDSGFFLGGPIAIGHRRLSIIDLRTGQQPIHNEACAEQGRSNGTVQVVSNGEIYNYRALRSELVKRGHRFYTTSDTEVIAHLYEEDGERCVEKLDGMFAIALFDLHRRKLWLARDRLGKKPLYYYIDSKRFVFGSEIKAILAHPDVPGRFFEPALPLYLTCGYVPTPYTFYENVYKLPPACYLSLGLDGQREIVEYWDFADVASSEGMNLPQDEAIQQLREHLIRAVEKRLISDVPLGAFLSGGIDSSIVVALMSQLMDEPVVTFTIGFTGDAWFNEVEYARLVAEQFGTDHHEFIVKPQAFDWLEELVWHYDEPFGDSSALPTYLLSKLTKDHVSVALCGDGGDELFAGYERFFLGQLTAAYNHVPAWLRRSIGKGIGALPGTGYRSRVATVRRVLEKLSRPLSEAFPLWLTYFDDMGVHQLGLGATPDGMEDSRPERIFRSCLERTPEASLLNQLLYYNIKTYLLEDLLVKADRMSMAHGLEVRSPFLDTDLLDFAMRLPARMKLRGWRSKYILKKAFSDLLPQTILNRPKHGFGVPLGAWFRHELDGYVRDTLLATDSRVSSYLAPEGIRQLVQEHASGRVDHGHQLWSLLTLEIWLRQIARE